jgi:dTMP kinase
VKRGKLIVFEGIDGCGKSTQLKLAAEGLRARGLDPIETREPTNGVWGRKIRAMAQSGERVSPQTELDWFFADRREHMEKVVEPGLAAGRIILSDRSYVSTVAYQGARGLDVSEILAASEAEFARPDLILLFELSPEEGMKRISARGGVLELVFEEYSFQQRVAAIFSELDLDGLVRIPAGRDPAEIAKDVEKAIMRVLDDRGAEPA